MNVSTFSVQTDLNLSDVWGEVGEEVAEGAVVGPGTQLAQEGAQHSQQTAPVASQPRDQDHCEHFNKIWNWFKRVHG